MRKQLLVLLLTSAPFILSAQDIIVKQDASEIQAKVESVSSDAVKYHKYSNPDGPIYTIKPSDVFMIKYENGERILMADYLKENKPEVSGFKQIEQEYKNNLKHEIHQHSIEVLPHARIAYDVAANSRFSSGGFYYGGGVNIDWFPSKQETIGLSAGFSYLQSNNVDFNLKNGPFIQNITIKRLDIRAMATLSNCSSNSWGVSARAGVVLALPLSATYAGATMSDGVKTAWGLGAEAGFSFSGLSLYLIYNYYLSGMFVADNVSTAFMQIGLGLGWRF